MAHAGYGDLKEFAIEVKESDESVTSDLSVNDDAELYFNIGADEEVHFEVWAYYTAGAGGIRVTMDGPAGFSHLHYSINLDVAGATKVSSEIAIAWGTELTDTTASDGMVRIVGHLKNGANAGNIKFQWSQHSSNPEATTISQGSVLKIMRY